jgi:hypothetical protein
LKSLMRMCSTPFGVALAAMAACTCTLTGSCQIVSNGGFELPVVGPSGFEIYSVGESFGGWTVGLGKVALWADQTIPPLVGDQSAVLNGALFQDLSAVPGGDYLLSFTVELADGSDLPPSLRVSFGSNSVVILSPGPLPRSYALAFTACSSTSRLQFASSRFGLALDDVAAEPIPRLGIASRGDGQAEITWRTDFPDYKLEFAAGLPASNWLPVTNDMLTNAEVFTATAATAGGQKVFRLRKP